jgi:hypothetical protein
MMGGWPCSRGIVGVVYGQQQEQRERDKIIGDKDLDHANIVL